MKILEHGDAGRLMPWLAMVFRCSLCGCKFRYEGADDPPRFETVRAPLPGESTRTERVYIGRCPECRHPSCYGEPP